MLDNRDEDFPVMFIDPVYATVTSVKDTIYKDDFDAEEWIKNSGLEGGIVKFSPQIAYKKPTSSYFLKMSEHTSTDMIAEYMDKAWKLQSPSIILSVISDPGHLKKWTDHQQKEDFQKGIIEAVNTTPLWILTNGVNSGVSKLIGDAVKMEKERRHLLATNYDRNLVTAAKIASLPKITAIGLLPISQLSYADQFCSLDREITVDLKSCNIMSEAVELNPNLTNFIMFDGVQSTKEANSRKLALEERFKEPVGNLHQFKYIYKDVSTDDLDALNTDYSSTPMVGLLIQGSPSDIEHVYGLIKMEVPVIILKGTGSATELLAFAYEKIKLRSDEDHLNSYVKPELLKRIQKTYHREFYTDVNARNRCRDTIIECIQLSMRKKQHFLTILDIETDPNGLSHLEKYILGALFEAREPKKDGKFQEQIHSDLKLTLDWNRSDLAASQIFQKFDWMNIKISGNLFDMALIRKDRHNFVELFLDTQAIELHKYFSRRKYLYLFNHFEDPEFFRTICLAEILGHSPKGGYPVQKKFLQGENSPLNILLNKTTYLSCLVSFDVFHMDRHDEDGVRLAIAERKAINYLVYWAALNYYPELTKKLWKRTEEPIAMAIIVSMIWHRMGKKWCQDSDLKRKLKASSKEFGQMAVQLLDYSYQDSNLNTKALLDKKLEDFNNKTIIELAHMANNKYFIAHSVCQKWLKRRWYGNLLIRKSKWGPKIPDWVKIYLSLAFIFPMFAWITYDLADKKRRDKKTEVPYPFEEFDEHNTLLDDPEPTHKSIFVEKWLLKPKETITYKMRSVWHCGRERFMVPLYLQFYYLWSAPITKFCLHQIFYILFLIVFSIATLHPNCGMLYLDIAVFLWMLLIWIGLVRATIVKWKKYKELDLFWTVCEIFVMACLLLVILTVRITPYFVTYFTYTDTKFLMTIGLLYFYYRVLFVFLPMSPVLGPMLISIKRMISKDFFTWFRMFLIIMVSGAIGIHAVLYPNYPLIFKGIRIALSRAFFAMFLTKIDDLEGDDTCSFRYKDSTQSRCYDISQNGSFFPAFYEEYYNATTKDEEEYGLLAKCPYSSLGGYAVVIQYLLIVKLIMITLLYALFSNTTSDIKARAEDIWKFQTYSLIVDFEERLILPPPFNIISYIVMIIQSIVSLIKFCYRKCKSASNCCQKKPSITENTGKSTPMMLNRSDDYSYWANFVKKLISDEEQENAKMHRIQTQSQLLISLKNQFIEQTEFNSRLVEQISALEQEVTSSHVALEHLQHAIDKLNSHLHPSTVPTNRFIHLQSRRSPYPKTTIQRFPVFDKFVLWEISYDSYDPVVYSCPLKYYPDERQPYVDPDFLESMREFKSKTKWQEKKRLAELIMPPWNSAYTVHDKDTEKIIDRLSFIKNNGGPFKYQLDSCNLPLNPKGRTGLRGRGRLCRWGPNHNVMVVITRWKKKDNSEELMVVDNKRVLEVIAIQKNEDAECSLPRGEECGYMTMYSGVCFKFRKYAVDDASNFIKPSMKDTNTSTQMENTKSNVDTSDSDDSSIQISDTSTQISVETGENDKDIKLDMNEYDMIQFFKDFCVPPDELTFSSKVTYKGYFDDPSNTDNAWREIEVWNFHYHQGGDEIDFKLKNKEKQWRMVSSYNTFHGSQDLILRQIATLHNAYY